MPFHGQVRSRHSGVCPASDPKGEPRMAGIAAGIVVLTGQVALIVAALIGAACVGVAIFLAVGMGSSHANERAKNALWGMVAAAVLSGSYKLIADTLASTLRGS